MLTEGLQARGLLTRATDVISLSPPLCITEAEVDRVVEIVDAAIAEMAARFGYA
jgi:adenosylmethionine-8-amino-7-oxononanoate aminotransferase